MSIEDFEIMSKLGLNVLRLGVMWPGVEPEEGKYDEEYLDHLEAIVALGADHGVYTLLDMHQDGLSEYFCGEGLPTWAVRHSQGFNEEKRGYPFPFDSPMTDFYTEDLLPTKPTLPTRQACSTKSQGPGWHEPTMASADAYQAFYDNIDGTLDRWAAMWAHVAERFKGNRAILGIELINEPFAGDLYHDPLIMVPRPNPRNGDKKNLQPAYQKAGAAIRDVDDDRLIFFAGSTWGDLGAGFSEPPVGNNTVLGYHYYDPPQLTPSSSHAALQFKAQARVAKELGTATFLTETSQPFMPPGSGDGEKEDGFSIKGGIGDAADSTLTGWAGYEWKSFCRESGDRDNKSQMGAYGACKTGYSSDWDGSEPPVEFQLANARTYARAIAGRAERMHFDVETKAFELKYVLTEVSFRGSETEIYTFEMNYPNGVTVDVKGPAVAVLDGNLVLVKPTSGATIGDEVMLTIS